MSLKNEQSRIIWFTGLSGSGKSTLSNNLFKRLKKKKFKKLMVIHLEKKIRLKKIFQRKE